MFKGVPDPVINLIEEIRNDRALGRLCRTFYARRTEFRSPEAAILAGIAASREARIEFDRGLDAMWGQSQPTGDVPDDCVVGAGLHAAIIASVRAQMGYPRVAVLESETRVGGNFAVSKEPSYFLNSRNRPGNIGLPGTAAALNVIPGAPLQPADISGDEFQRNSDLAFCIRVALAFHADVIARYKVESIERGSDNIRLTLADGRTFVVRRRVFVATGLGRAKMVYPNGRKPDSRIKTFPEFMAMFDEPYPLKGIRTAAVIGAGDSGKVAVEALTGQGPNMGLSVASLDYVERIEWYGVPPECINREGWEANSRTRYKRIACLLPRQNTQAARVYPVVDEDGVSMRANSVAEGFNSAYVNERPYDLVIDCTGYEVDSRIEFPGSSSLEDYIIGNRLVARRLNTDPVYLIGPCADLRVTDAERESTPAIVDIPENSTALFRYADRTASLAASLNGNENAIVGVTEIGDYPAAEQDTELEVGDYVVYSEHPNDVGLVTAAKVESGAYVQVRPVFGTPYGQPRTRPGSGEYAVYQFGSRETVQKIEVIKYKSRAPLVDADERPLIVGRTYSVVGSGVVIGELASGVTDNSEDGAVMVGLLNARRENEFGDDEFGDDEFDDDEPVASQMFKVNGTPVFGVQPSSLSLVTE